MSTHADARCRLGICWIEIFDGMFAAPERQRKALRSANAGPHDRLFQPSTAVNEEMVRGLLLSRIVKSCYCIPVTGEPDL